MRLPRIVLLISGCGSNMEALIGHVQHGVLRDRCEVAAVIANRDAPGLAAAERLGVPVQIVPSVGLGTVAYGIALLEALEKLDPDLIVLAGFMRFISPSMISRYRGRILNIHPADTKAYQGPDGYGWAHEAGLEKTMITVHLVDEGIDTGTVLGQAEVDLHGAESLEAVRRRGLDVEHRFYAEALGNFLSQWDATAGAFRIDGEVA